MDRASVARLAGMERQTLRDWVHRFAARLREIAQAHPQPSGFFGTANEIIDRCCAAWNWLLAKTGRIGSAVLLSLAQMCQ